MAERTNPHSEIIVGAQDNASPTFDQIRNSVEKMALAMKQSSDKANGALKDMDTQAEASARATKSALSAISRAQTEAMRGLVEAGGYAYRSADGIEYLAKLRKADATAIQGQVAALRELEAVMSAASAKQRELASQQNFLANLTRETEGIGKTRAELVALQAAQLGVADKAAPLIAKLREQETQFGANGKSAKEMQAALRGVPAQLTDIVVSLQGGQAPLTVFLQQGGQLRDMFGGAGVAARALGSAVLGMVNPLTVSLATVAGLSYAYNQGSKEADAFRLALVSTGSASGATVGQLQQMAASIDAVVGTQAKAAETLALFATQTVAGKASMEQYATAAIAWEQASGESVESVAKKFGSLKDAPLQGVLKLNESMNFLTESVYAQIKSLEEQGKTTEAAKVAQDALANALQDRSAEMVKNLGSIERGWRNVKHAVAETWDAIKGIGRVTPPEELLSASRSRVNVMQAEYDYKSQRGMSTGTLGERLEKEKGLLATLQAQVKANADSAQAEADRLARVNARADADKNALKYLDDQAKMARQIAAERETIQRAYTGKTDAASQKAMAAEIEASEANIRKSYEKTKKVRESAATSENEVASIRAKIAEQTRYLQTMQETGVEYTKLTEGERLVIKINEELQTGLKGAARANKEKALAAAEALVVVEKQVSAEQALAKSNAESEAAYRKDLSAMAQRTDAIDAQAAQLEAANALYGKGKIAIEAYTLQLEQERLKRLNALGLQGAMTEELTREIEARERLIVAMKKAEFKAASQKSTESLEQAKAANDLVREEIGLIGMTEVERKKIIAARKAEIELAKELRAIDAMGIDESDKETLRIEARAKSRVDAETNAARAVRDEWQKTADDINRSLTDALLRGFESGKDFAKNLRDTIKNMFSTLVLRPIISAVMTPVSGMVNGMVQGGMKAVGMGGNSNLMGMASNASSLYSGASSFNTGWFTNFGATAPASLYSSGAQLYSQGFETIGSGMMDLGNSMAQYSDAISTAGSWLGYGKAIYDLTQGNYGSAVGTAIGTYFGGPIGAAIGSFAGGLVDKWTGSRGANHSGGVYSTATPDRMAAAAGLGLSGDALGDFTQRGNTAIDAQLGTAVGALSGVYQSLAKYAGDSARQIDIVAGFAVNGKYKDEDAYGYFKLLDKLTGEELASYAKRDGGLGNDPEKAWAQYVADMGAALVGEIRKADIPKWMDNIFAGLGDKITTQGLDVALQQIAKIDGAFTQLGNSIGYLADISGATQTALLDLSGGIDALMTNAGAYYENFYSADEQRAAIQRQLTKAFEGLDLKLPDIDASDARAQFRALAEAQDLTTDSGRKTYASLLQLSGAFAGITQSADEAAQAAQRLADQQQRQADDAVNQALAQLRQVVKRERDALSAQADTLESVIGQIGSAVGLLTSNARELYGSVDSTQQMLAAQGMVYIEDALAGVRAGASVVDYGGLADAIGAARSGVNAGVYASEFERQRDTLVLAGQLAELGQISDAQLSVEERALKAVQEQIAQLDKTLDYWEQQASGMGDLLNASLSIEGAIGSLAAALAQREAAKKPAGGGGGGRPGVDLNQGLQKQIAEAWNAGDWITAQNIIRGYGFSNDQLKEAFDLNYADLRYLYSHGYTSQNPGDYSFSAKTAEGVYAEAKAQGLTLAEVDKIINAPAGTAEEWAKANGLPIFHQGTNYVPRTGFALLEQGEQVVPRAYNPFAGGQMPQGNNAELIAEVRALRAEVAALRAPMEQTAQATAQQAEQFDNVTAGGNAMATEVMA